MNAPTSQDTLRNCGNPRSGQGCSNIAHLRIGREPTPEQMVALLQASTAMQRSRAQALLCRMARHAWRIVPPAAGERTDAGNPSPSRHAATWAVSVAGTRYHLHGGHHAVPRIVAITD